MLSSHGLTWDEYMIVGAIAALMYPEATLSLIERVSGKILGLKTVIVFEIGGVVLIGLFMEIMRHYNPHLRPWFPIIPISIFLIRHAAASLSDDVFGK